MAKQIPLALIASLVLVELGAAVYAAIPDVNDNYRAFYLDRTTWCLDLQPSGVYTLGTQVSLARGHDGTFDNIHRCGFGVTLRDGTWLKGDLARLELTLPAGTGGLDFSFDVSPFLDRQWHLQRMHVSANGAELATVEMTERGRHSITIPTDIVALSPDRLAIELTVDDTRKDRGRPVDRQRDAVMFHSLQIAEASAAP